MAVLPNSANRKHLSDYVIGMNTDMSARKSCAVVTVKSPSGAGDITVDPIGLALVSSGAGEFTIMEDTDTIPTGDVTLFGHPSVGVLAGAPNFCGDNREDMVITEAGVKAYVVIADATVVGSRLIFDTVSADSAMAAEKVLFTNQLLEQDIAVQAASVDANASYA